MSNFPPSVTMALPAFGDAELVGSLAVTAPVNTSGARTLLTVTGVADTGVTASTEQPDAYFNGARIVTWATGALTNQRSFRFAAPTLASNAPSAGRSGPGPVSGGSPKSTSPTSSTEAATDGSARSRWSAADCK